MNKSLQKISLIIIIMLCLMLTSCEDTNCDMNGDGTVDTVEKKICEKGTFEKTPKQEQRADEEEQAEISNNDETKYTINTAFISIHMEPGSNPSTTDYPALHWTDLVNLVALADEYNVKLSLVFNPQWATYILDDEEKLTLLRSWEANGHEIGLHHHGPHHGGWNGYTDQEEYKDYLKYIGTVEEMMNLVNQLPVSGQVLVAGIGAEEDVDYDWPEDIIYETDGGADPEGDILSNPTTNTYNDHSVISLRHAQYQVGKMSLTLEQIESYLQEPQTEEYMGIVFHEKNYAEDPEKIEELFQLFQEYDVKVKTVQNIMEEEGY
ncbi:hypothetical protein HZC31_01845 [Candidatus Woesearchaeota archaeon]|nr:hypothetical protein [Candidatus Woesearchaeota archaeon]